MFKTLFGLAVAAPALAVDAADLVSMQCQAMTTQAGTVFNVEGIEFSEPDHYSYPVNGVT